MAYYLRMCNYNRCKIDREESESELLFVVTVVISIIRRHLLCGGVISLYYPHAAYNTQMQH